MSDPSRIAEFHDAAWDGDSQKLKALLQETPAIVNASSSDQHRYTALHFASMEGHLGAVEVLLQHGANVDARDRLGCTPLHLAAQFAHKDTVEILLANGADATAKSYRGTTPGFLVEAGDHPDIAALLRTFRIGRIDYSPKELVAFVALRALEWEGLPIYGTRAFAPIALVWVDWWQLLLALAVLQVGWNLVKTRFVSLKVADRICQFNNVIVSITANVVIALVFLYKGLVLNAVLSILWHLISAFLAAPLTFAPPRPHAAQIITAKMTSQAGFTVSGS